MGKRYKTVKFRPRDEGDVEADVGLTEAFYKHVEDSLNALSAEGWQLVDLDWEMCVFLFEREDPREGGTQEMSAGTAHERTNGRINERTDERC